MLQPPTTSPRACNTAPHPLPLPPPHPTPSLTSHSLPQELAAAKAARKAEEAETKEERAAERALEARARKAAAAAAAAEKAAAFGELLLLAWGWGTGRSTEAGLGRKIVLAGPGDKTGCLCSTKQQFSLFFLLLDLRGKQVLGCYGPTNKTCQTPSRLCSSPHCPNPCHCCTQMPTPPRRRVTALWPCQTPAWRAS